MTIRIYASFPRALAVGLAVVTVLTGCGRSLRQAPPARQVQAAVAAALPPCCKLQRLEQEPITINPESVKVNFKALVVVTEDLYQAERAVTGAPKVTLLKLVQAEGSKRALYGSVVAHRLIDQWTLGVPQLQLGPQPFGKPRDAFNAHAYVAGTAEAHAALAAAAQEQQSQKAALEKLERETLAQAERDESERKARAELQARSEQVRKERLEQARLAFEAQSRKEAAQRLQAEEQRQQAGAAARQKLLQATAVGTRYVGSKTGYNASVQRIGLVFTEQKNTLLRAEVINPDDPSEKRAFTGELRFNAEPDKAGAVAYAIVLEGQRAHKSNPNPNSIYDRAVTLRLQLAADGLEGVADAGLGEQFPVRLQGAAAPAK
jgi:hypothetical protein